MGLLSSIFGKKDKKEKRADFGNVSSGTSSTAREVRRPTVPQADPTPTTAPTASGASTTTGTHYEIQAGDTLSAIAKRHYGDAGKWRRIYEANRDVIDDPDKIYPGQKITIPPKA